MTEEPNGAPIFALGTLFGTILAVSLSFEFRLVPEAVDGGRMSYADMAAIMLGAVAIIITVLTVFIAVLALWGYGQFKRSASRAASKHVEAQLNGGPLREEIATIIIAEVTRQMDGGKLRAIMEHQVNRQIYLGAGRRAAAENKDAIGDEEKEYGE